MKKGTKCLTDQIRKMLEKHISNYDPIEKKEIIKSIKDHLVAVLISKALSGEDRAITEILDRVEGKAVQSINAEINIDMADKRKKFEDMFSGINDN